MDLMKALASLGRRLNFAYEPQGEPPKQVTKRWATPSKSDYLEGFGGHLANPDKVLAQFGTWNGLATYERVLYQFPNIYAAFQQRIDRVPERKIVAGDPSVDVSVAMARDVQRAWSNMPGRENIQQKLLWGMAYGFAPVEKVWSQDLMTDLVGPFRLFDQPPRNVKFDEDGSAWFITKGSARGEQIADGRFMFFRWRSQWTPYGEGELMFIYPVLWMMQNIVDFGLQALEQLGRPIPVYHIPSTLDPDEVKKIEEAAATMYKFYSMLPTDDTRTSVEFPGINVTAGGGAGRAEFEALRYFDGWCQRAILGTQQTQDRAGGSRALEEVRTQIVDDKTRQASDTLDEVLNNQWLWSDVCPFNFSAQPKELWPMFATDAQETNAEKLNGIQASTAAEMLLRLAANQITADAAESIIGSLGIPKGQAKDIVKSTVAAAGSLSIAPDIGGESQDREDGDGGVNE